MPWKRKFKGGVLAMVGFMLSPLSWWNDLFVNVPLALAFAWVVSLLYPPSFKIACVMGYWLTNVLGFVLLHKGAQSMLGEAGAQIFTTGFRQGPGDFVALHGVNRAAD
jgi:hypothetical protein